MYWLYLLLLTCALVLPGFIERGLFSSLADREIVELVFVSVISLLAFALYVIRDRQSLRYKKELAGKQKEISRFTKELSLSYSYIGEANRKFEILQGVTLEIPELLKGEKENLYYDILRAIRIFSGCSDFIVIFYSKKEGGGCAQFFLPDSKLIAIPKEIHISEIAKKKIRFIKHSGEYCVMEASGTIAGVHCFGIFQCFSLREDIVDLLRPLLMQALLLYSYSKKEQQKNLPPCNI